MKQLSKGFSILSGILYVILGIMTLRTPGQMLIAYVYYIGFATFFSGILGLVFYFKGEREGNILFVSIIDIICGILFFTINGVPIFIALGVPFFIGVWAVFRGIVEIVHSIQIRHDNKNWIWRLIWGVLLVFSGIYFFNNPLISTIVVIQYFGVFAIVIGVVWIIEGFVRFFKK